MPQGRADHGPATERDDRGAPERVRGQLLLQLPEGCLTVVGEDVSDAASGVLFDDGIQVDERETQTVRQQCPHGALAGTRQTNQHQPGSADRPAAAAAHWCTWSPRSAM